MKSGYKVTINDPATGSPLNSEGKWLRSGEPQLTVVLPTRNEALKKKDELIDEFAYCEVWIDGPDPTEHGERFVDEGRLAAYLDEKMAFQKWKAIPWPIRSFCQKPECRLYIEGKGL